jgi:NAD(P)-dependent dehydrogenase (short-subunit alcohol dehydrogenase family)
MEKLIREGRKDSISSNVPMDRRGEPEDVTSLVLFLTPEASSHPTGHVYSIDAGLVARGKEEVWK